MPSVQSNPRLLVFGAFVAGLSVGLAVVAWTHIRSVQKRTLLSKEVSSTVPRGVARVGDSWITSEKFKAAWTRHSHAGEPADSREAVLEGLIRRALVFEEARQTGFDRSEEMQEAWRSLVVTRFEEARESRHQHPTDFSEAQIESYYREHADRFAMSERRRLEVVYHPVPAGVTGERRDRIASLLRSLREEIVANPSTLGLGPLVDGFAAREGRRLNRQTVGWLTREQAIRAWPSQVVETAFQLRQPGETSAVLETDEGLYVLRLDGCQLAHAPALESVKDRVRYEMARAFNAEQDARYFEELRRRHPVQTLADALETAAPTGPALAQQPPRFPTR